MIAEDLDTLDPDQLRQALRATRVEVAFKQALIDKLTHENASLKRLKFSAQSEKYSAEQRSLLDETFDADLAALAAEIETVRSSDRPEGDKQQPKREKLPPHLPRREIRHEPETPPAAAARRCSASARTWRRSGTTSRACSRWSATSAASG